MTGWATFAAVLFWLAPFLVGKNLRWASSSRRRSWLSAAAGVAIAYVFIDLLPQMSRMQRSFVVAVEGRALLAPEFRVYFSALAGFIVFYSIQVLKPRGGSESPLFHRVDFFGFAAYCGLMGYLLVVEESTLLSLTLYTVAMFFHFLLVDHSLRHEHGEIYDRSGRWIIVAGLLAGWLAGLSGLTFETLVPTMIGFIGGGVVINSVRGELPEAGEGRVLPLAMGALVYAGLLVMVEFVRKQGDAGAIPQ